MNDDTTLADTTPDQAPTSGQAGGVFVLPTTPNAAPTKVWTLDEVLAEAELTEKRASICLKPNLQARRDQILAELATLVTVDGHVLVTDDEPSAADQGPEARVLELRDELGALTSQMREAMWFPLFKGISVDDLAVFNKAHAPKRDGDDMTDYQNRLVAETSLDPKMTLEQVQALRHKLGFAAMKQLVDTANEVCTKGGVDVPFLPSFSRAPKDA